MFIGGVLLAAGMEMVIAAEDHLDGSTTVRFLLSHVAGTRENGSWVILEGTERPDGTSYRTWGSRTLCVRVEALKRCLALTDH